MTITLHDKSGHEIRVGDRVRFDCAGLSGHGQLGTVTRIERDCVYNESTGNYDQPWGDDDNYVLWVRWDCHGQENGECLNLKTGSREWFFVSRQMPLVAGVAA